MYLFSIAISRPTTNLSVLSKVGSNFKAAPMPLQGLLSVASGENFQVEL